MAAITGVCARVHVEMSLHGETWEGRYLIPPGSGERYKASMQKTTVRCPMCRLRFLRKPSIRPVGRVIHVLGPPENGWQDVILDPLPRSMTVVICTHFSHGHLDFVVTHAKWRQLVASTEPLNARL